LSRAAMRASSSPCWRPLGHDDVGGGEKRGHFGG
jgi:hypothetical protein